MSVVVQNSHGWFVDACSLIDQGYSRCIRWRGNQQSHVKCGFNRRCFQVPKHFGNDSESAPVDGTYTCRPSKKRPRKLNELNQGEIDSQVFHETVRSVILEGTRSLVDSAQSLGYLKGETDKLKEPLPFQECNLAALCEMAKELPLVADEEQEECVQFLVAKDGCTAHVDLFSRVTENREDWSAVVTLMGEEYVIPQHSAFLLSDFKQMQPLIHYGRKFDLIVMDPPWENKSVKRSRRYGFLPSSQLKGLPIPLLAAPNCLVVTWVTNRCSHQRFVRDELYPHWGVEVIAEWFWVKVSTCGQFVFPLDSPHKKPYEVLVLGRYHPPSDISKSSSEASEILVEDHRLIVSTPSVFHSQKPSLSEVLKPYVGAEAKCLELFARSLQPRWTSWGNEVLKFQHTRYFTLTAADAPEDIAKEEEGTNKPTVTPASSSPRRSSSPHHYPTTVD